MKLFVKLSDGSEDVYEGTEAAPFEHEVKDDGTLTVSALGFVKYREGSEPDGPARLIRSRRPVAVYKPSGWIRWRMDD